MRILLMSLILIADHLRAAFWNSSFVSQRVCMDQQRRGNNITCRDDSFKTLGTFPQEHELKTLM